MDIGSDLYFHIHYLIQVVATRKYWESKLTIKTDNQDENLPFIMHPHTHTHSVYLNSGKIFIMHYYAKVNYGSENYMYE